MNNTMPRPQFPQRQQGAALVMGLIILVLLTMLGVTTMRTTTLEERMASHSADRVMAMQSAEAALRAGENYLNGAVIGPFNNTNGLYMPRVPGAGCAANLPCYPWWSDGTTWSNNANHRVYPGTMTDMDVNQVPRFIIENLSEAVSCDTRFGTCNWSKKTSGWSIKAGAQIQDAGIYRVTARGVGGQTDAAGNPVTVVLLQSTFRR